MSTKQINNVIGLFSKALKRRFPALDWPCLPLLGLLAGCPNLQPITLCLSKHPDNGRHWLPGHPAMKLDGVGPVDNRPSYDKLPHFVQKNIYTCDMWQVTCGVGWTLSRNVISLGLTVCFKWYVEDLEEKDDLINEWMSDNSVCRTALATPGKLMTRMLAISSWVFWVVLNQLTSKYFDSKETLATTTPSVHKHIHNKFKFLKISHNIQEMVWLLADIIDEAGFVKYS